MNYAEDIKILKNKKNAILLAHYYVDGKIQDIADFTGDSLALSQAAATTKADIIVFAGVHFMAETAKILCPDKKVLLPDLKAGCSLADSCPVDDFEKFVKANPDHVVISYVNTTAKVKALTDVICTSSNAKEIVDSFLESQKIIFGPDRNLGDYINKITGRNMKLWDGACHVHQEFSLTKILALKKLHPKAKILAHPECCKPILEISDFIGSTAAILKFSIHDSAKSFIVATESGILHQMRKESPEKEFIPAPGENDLCDCNDCQFMKMNSLEKIYNCLLNETNEIHVDFETAQKAVIPIRRMLEISEKIKK